jgi:pimeloyl-ACP methyl ester carboxylesterase
VSDRDRDLVQERIAHFGRPKSLAGVTSFPPAAQPVRPQTVVIVNVGVIHRVGPSRLHVQLARRLAEDGFVTLRFDFSGIGDSDPRPERVVPDGVRQDMNDALSYLQATANATSFVLVGLCSGANACLRYARLHEGVAGAVLLDPHSYKTPGYYLRHYRRRLLQWESWRNVLKGPWGGEQSARAGYEAGPPSGDGLVAPPTVIPRPEMEEGIAELTARGVQLLNVFTGGHEAYNDREQFWELFPRLKGRAEIQVEFLASADHTFHRRSARREVIALIRDWMVTRTFARAPQAQPEAEAVLS